MNARDRSASFNASFIEGLRLDYGAIPMMSRFLLKADALVRKRGIHLSFDTINKLAELNAENFDSWGRFAPQLDTRVGDLGSDDAYCLIGRNDSGAIVAAQAGRVYQTSDRTLQNIAEDRSLYYGRSTPPAGGLTCTLTSPGAKVISNRFVYSGGLWVHPDYRGHKLAGILPRVSRCYALGRWNTQFTFAFIGEKMASSQLFGLYGYERIEPSYTFFESGNPVYTGSLMWMTTDELLRDLADFDETSLGPQYSAAGLSG